MNEEVQKAIQEFLKEAKDSKIKSEKPYNSPEAKAIHETNVILATGFSLVCSQLLLISSKEG